MTMFLTAESFQWASTGVVIINPDVSAAFVVLCHRDAIGIDRKVA